MAITKDGEVYRLDFYPNGRSGKRIVKTFKTKKEAEIRRRYGRALQGHYEH